MKTAIKIIGTLLIIGLGTYIFTTYIDPTPRNRAERAVESYLKENLSDPSGYEPISFGNLDTMPIFDDIPNRDGSLKTELDSLDGIPNPLHHQDNAVFFIITHSYRAKNEYGAFTIYSVSYGLNKEFQVVWVI